MGSNTLRWMGGLLVLYLVAPIALFAVRFARAPERGFHIPGLFDSLWISISCASVALAVVCIFGLPLAYVLGRSKNRLARLVEAAVTLPLALPPVMGGIVVVYLVGPYSFLGGLFERRLTNSVYGIVIAMTFCSAPFLILSARAAFATIDQGTLDVASTLGHSDVSRFLRVAVPAARQEIRAGMAMTWLRAFGEYGAVTILAYNPASLPIYTVNQFMARGIAPTLAPTMLALLVAAVVVVVSRVHWPPIARVDPAGIRGVAPTLRRSARLSFDISERLGSFHLRVRHTSRHDNLAVVGPSGSGKSVLLRCLAGLYGPSVGAVAYGQDDVSRLAPERRPVGYVAQGFALFEHLSVWGNLMFSTTAREGDAAYWLHRLRLDGLENRYPSQLSGGERQRVALAQALVQSPEVLLLDEPFSGLDAPLRRDLQRELRRLQRDTGIATIIVTHDPEEAAYLAEEIIVISGGEALQSGTNREVFTRPASARVARLLGISNVHRARVAPTGLSGAGGTHIDVDTRALESGTSMLWKVRPDRIEVRPLDEQTASGPHVVAFSGVLTDLADVGSAVDLFVRVDEEIELHVRAAEIPDFGVGQACVARVKIEDIEFWVDPEPPGPGVTSPPGPTTTDVRSVL